MTARPDADVRDALETAALPAGLVLDTTAVLERGHRTVRRRRVLRAVVAATAVIAVGVALGVAAGRTGANRAIPAGASDQPVTTLYADGGAGSDVRKIEVTYDAARRTGTFLVDRTTGPQTSAEVVLDGVTGGGFTVTGAGTDHAVLLVLVPDDLSVRPWPPPRLGPAQWSAAGNLTGTDLLAQVRSLDPAEQEPRTLYREDPTRGAVFGDGSRVDVAHLTVGRADVTVWLNPSHRVSGSAESVDGEPTSGGSGDLDGPLDGGFLHLSGSMEDRDAAGVPVSTTSGTGLLPAGATHVEPVFRAARPNGIDLGSAVMTGDGRVALAVRCVATASHDRSSDSVCAELRGVSWVDRAGTARFTPLI
jgi:hypothetical protein